MSHHPDANILAEAIMGLRRDYHEAQEAARAIGLGLDAAYRDLLSHMQEHDLKEVVTEDGTTIVREYLRFLGCDTLNYIAPKGKEEHNRPAFGGVIRQDNPHGT